MIHRKFTRKFYGVMKAAAMALATTIFYNPVSAQELFFADDFSTDSLRYGVQLYNDTTQEYQLEKVESGMKATVIGEGERYGSLVIVPSGITDSLSTRFTLSSESALQRGGDFTSSTMRLEGTFYSDNPIAGSGSNGNEGDIQVVLQISDGNFGPFANYCVYRRDADGFTQNLIVDGVEICGNFDDSFTPQIDVEYQASIALDRNTRQLVMRINELTRNVDIPGEIFDANNPDARLQFYQAGLPGTGVAFIHGIATDNFDDDFRTTDPVIGRYRGADSGVSYENQRLRFTTTAEADENSEQARLYFFNGIDHMEALLRVSSESILNPSVDGRVQARLQGRLYNDTADSGFDGRTGDVYANIGIEFGGNGRKRAQYCLERTVDPEGNERRDAVIPELDGEQCGSFEFQPQMDTDYRTSVSLDRDAKTITFRINNRVVVHNISTGIFAAASPYREVDVQARDASTAVVYVDNVRTAADQLTASELVSGAEPQVPTGSDDGTEGSLVANNPLQALPEPAPLAFTDDFSTSAANLTFSGRNDGGRSQVVVVNGAVELRTASGEDEDSWAELQLLGDTDYVAARVSLSSLSSSPVNGDTRIRIQGRFYNEIQDGGTGEGIGDVYVQLRLRQRGDGRRELSFCIDRETENGSEGVDIVDGRNCGDFDGFVPELDTAYSISVRLDREQGLLIFKADERTREIAINTPIYKAYRNDKQVSISHSGITGATVGRIYSVETDNFSQDFAAESAVIPPYQPFWDSRNPDREIRIENGKAILQATATAGNERRMRIFLEGSSDFIGALVNLSSTSTIAADGSARVRVAGTFYNDIADGGNNSVENDREGEVFATTNLFYLGDGSTFAEYCVWRSNTSDWSDSILLTPGANAEECARFGTAPMLDTDYAISTMLDRAAGKIVFEFAGEIQEYAIPTGIFTPVQQFKRVSVTAFEDTTAIGFVDDLQSAPGAPLLAQSDSLLGTTPLPLLPGETASGGPSGGETGGTTGGGGGGCSVSADTFNPFLPLLALLSLIAIHIRGRKSLR